MIYLYQMKMIIFVPVSFVKRRQLVSTLTSPVPPLFLYNIGLIKILLYRAFKISSSWSFFDQEKQTIKNLLMKNLHPSYLIDREIKKFLENKFTAKKITSIVHNSKRVSYYKLIYIGSYSKSYVKLRVM